MTTFVLVPGGFTGGWVWEETAARLGRAGAEAHPVTLTGMDGLSGETGIGLETHVEDLVRLIDGLAAAEVVLVGHGYGLHPVLGAADRRPGRVARIVALDTLLPQDGEPAERSVPDPGGRAGTDGRVPPPTRETRSRWGDLEGVPEETLVRLERLAVPQPADTLTAPLRLTGAASALPVTGVLCTAAGSSVAMVEMLVESGPPRFRALADDRIRFLELATGHWPMLSAPAALAETLL
ncbi:alpha/beta fold hydrolase, partial [Streptomyces cinereoruber]